MVQHQAPMCVHCIHLHPVSGKTRNTCDAFPDGIPEKILDGEFRHTRHYSGDHGIRYERDPSKPLPPWEGE